MRDPDTIIAELGLRPHPEGGHYAETWRADVEAGARPAGTAIYYLLRAGERSRWHRVDASEVWHYYAGEPLALSIASGSGSRPPRMLICSEGRSSFGIESSASRFSRKAT